jgi:Tfp pilus assembly major pilin PilA
MLAWSVVALIISGAFGETTRCAAGPEIVHAYGEDAHCSDSASLIQLKAMEHVHRKSDVVAALHSASSTRRCAEGAYSPVVGDCGFSDWSEWGTCSTTCGSGERSRDRTVLSGTCDGACLKEDETCNSDECPDEACPPGTVRAWGSDCPDNGVNEVTTTPAPFCDENGMTASGKKCEGKIKTKIQTSRITRACQTASGDDCDGEFQIKYRTTYEDKDGEWVKFKREMSRDGGKTWKPLPLLLSQLATFTQDADEALPPSCCVPTPSPTPAPIPPTPTPLLEKSIGEGESPVCHLQPCAYGAPSTSRVPWDWSVNWVVNFT